MIAIPCEIHGTQAGMPMCPSVFAARNEGRRIEVAMHCERLGLACLRCAACSKEVLAGLEGRESIFDFEGPLEVDCRVCVDEWLAATGHPSFREMYAALSAPAGSRG